MGTLPRGLATSLKSTLGLRRAVETGTFMGGGARALAAIFGHVVTIELSPELHTRAAAALADLPNVRPVLGDSRERLGPIAAERVPTLYWLDGHWSGGMTAGADAECPVLDELAALARGHTDDCIIVDDARLFAAAPPPPHDPSQWPTLVELIDAIRTQKPAHHVTVLHDLIIAVPWVAKAAVDEFGREPAASTQQTGKPLKRARGATTAGLTRLAAAARRRRA